jgi:YfiH family protein
MMAPFLKSSDFNMSIYLTSDILPSPHGFFTRNGGCSEGIYKSLNCGTGSNDDADHILKNRCTALNEISKNADLIALYQIHSNITHIIDIPTTERLQGDRAGERRRGDSIVTNKPHLALSILTADCAPVLFHDAKNNVIGAAHAGWNGAYSGVLQNTVKTMCEIGAEREHINAAIGPCIAQASYEVGPEFFERIDQPQFFIPSEKTHHHLFDLPAFVQDQLICCSIEQIDHLESDTYQEEESFFSYRRSTHKNQKDYGRQISIICLP